MVSLTQKINAEIENIETTLSKLYPVLKVKDKGFPELAALATILQNFYNGVENILKQILFSLDIQIDITGNWHKDLLEEAGSKQILSESLKNELYEYLIFRHYFVHGYAIRLEETPLTTLTDKLEEVWGKFLFEIKSYYQ
ncbi:MAG: hypothetical protein H8E82_01725 [Candidatus Marinimicrobia bacterium]|nr:hypothetical protein [Candidatus Neomarinimicrobiota bacterium]MBL7047514.1 hypothetical protein [Candidatus Neomarinimicrobiota bacterium]